MVGCHNTELSLASQLSNELGTFVRTNYFLENISLNEPNYYENFILVHYTNPKYSAYHRGLLNNIMEGLKVSQSINLFNEIIKTQEVT